MKLTQFDPPGNSGDFAGNPALAAKWSAEMSQNFAAGINSAKDMLLASGGTCQFYNPVTDGRSDPDLAPADIFWNGFPRKMLGHGPGAPANFAGAEAPVDSGEPRDQDEYLEWHTVRNAANQITSVQLTCEGWDYYEFLGREAPDVLVELYKTFINPAITKAELFPGGTYDRLNRWTTRDGAMHLTHPANSLGAEVRLGAEATIRRKNSAGVEITSADVLCKCGSFGDNRRNSDPAIGAGVNALSRQGRMITLANPVGLYIDHLDDAGFSLPDGSPTTGWLQILRGSPGKTIRAVFAPPAGSAFTISDVKIGGVPVQFGGQIAQKVTMKLTGVASVANNVHNSLIKCAVPVGVAHIAAPLAAAMTHPGRGGV